MYGPDYFDLSRRDFIVIGAGAAAASQLVGGTTTPPATAATASAVPKVSLNVNGKTHELTLDTRTSLLDALREHLHFTGTKKGSTGSRGGPISSDSSRPYSAHNEQVTPVTATSVVGESARRRTCIPPLSGIAGKPTCSVRIL